MPRVVVVLTSTQLSGAEKRFLRLFRVWDKPNLVLAINGELVTAAEMTAEFAETLVKLRKEHRFEVISSGSLYSTTRQLVRVIAERQVQIVHSVLSFAPSLLAAQVTRRPMVFEVTSPDVVRALLGGKQRFFLQRVACFHAVSPSVAGRLSRAFTEAGQERLRDRIRTAPLPLFVPPNGRNEVEKENLIVFAARLIPRKNPLLFASVVQEFTERRPDWKVAMLGQGPMRDEVSRILEKELRNRQVELTYKTNIYDYLQRSMIFVSLVYPDNYPSQAVLEAMFAANALLLTNGGFSSRFINVEQPNGYLVDYEPESVLDALVKLTEEREQTLLMGRASKEYLQEEFAAERYLEHLGSLYDQLLG